MIFAEGNKSFTNISMKNYCFKFSPDCSGYAVWSVGICSV